jgi:hypothetical protein
MRSLGAAVKMRQSSESRDKQQPPTAVTTCHSHKMFASGLGLLIMLLINNLNQCVAFNNVHNKNSSHHHHHYHHEKAFDGTANNVLSLVLPHDTCKFKFF